MDATRVALANLASSKLGRSSIRNASEGDDGEENGRKMNEHVGIDTIGLDFLAAGNGYTHFLYLEIPLLRPSWRRHTPWKGEGTGRATMMVQGSLNSSLSSHVKSIVHLTMFV